jgi:hypothetical protein
LEVWEGKKCAILGSLRNSEADLKDDLRRRGYERVLRACGLMED